MNELNEHYRYQCSLSTYRQAGYSDIDAGTSMRNAVRLADEARLAYAKENPDEVIKIALSLGPFGASLTPAQDFDGYYPPPFGPMEYSTTRENCNSFGKDVGRENDAVKALAQFHLERLLIFAHDPIIWGVIDCIAFETIPLAREVKAVRQAMLQLRKKLAADDMTLEAKPWWISFVVPDGKCSERQYAGRPLATVSDMVSAALQWRPIPLGDTDEVETVPIPTGIGINCVLMNFFAALVDEMSKAVDSMRGAEKPKPWLVLYPNGGDTYDPISRTWEAQEKVDKRSWATEFGGIIKEIADTSVPRVWAGIVCGGCCRTRPDDISALNTALSRKV